MQEHRHTTSHPTLVLTSSKRESARAFTRLRMPCRCMASGGTPPFPPSVGPGPSMQYQHANRGLSQWPPTESHAGIACGWWGAGPLHHQKCQGPISSLTLLGVGRAALEGGGRLKRGSKRGCTSGYWRLESGLSSRAGGCKAVGGQWEAYRSGWGGADSPP